MNVAADLIPYEHIGFGENRENQLSKLGISHLMLISIQIKNSLYSFFKSFIAIIYIVIIYYPKKITWMIFIPFVSWKNFLKRHRIKRLHNFFKKTFKSRHKCIKKRSLLEVPFAICSGRNKKSNKTKKIWWQEILTKTSAKRIIRSDWFETVTNFINLCSSDLMMSYTFLFP